MSAIHQEAAWRRRALSSRERRQQVTIRFKPFDGEHSLPPSALDRAPDMDDPVDRLGDRAPGRPGDHFDDQILDATQHVFGGVGVDRRQTTGMPGVPALQGLKRGGPVARVLGQVGGALLFLFFLIGPDVGLDPLQRKVAATTALTACLWVTVAIPVGAASLFPAALFPLLGVMSARTTSAEPSSGTTYRFEWYEFQFSEGNCASAWIDPATPSTSMRPTSKR